MVFGNPRGGRISRYSSKSAAVWQKGLAKAKQGSHLQVLEKMTDLVDNKQRIVENAPFVVRETKTEREFLSVRPSGYSWSNIYLPYRRIEDS